MCSVVTELVWVVLIVKQKWIYMCRSIHSTIARTIRPVAIHVLLNAIPVATQLKANGTPGGSGGLVNFMQYTRFILCTGRAVCIIYRQNFLWSCQLATIKAISFMCPGKLATCMMAS